ncbi:unnamed protein product [Xylocopa violacea]|uniref:Uncharacterized protein n=1 Tax=Xylocopa violacea TaxID=135666 RepID=A0ABP1PFM4_XYLVO
MSVTRSYFFVLTFLVNFMVMLAESKNNQRSYSSSNQGLIFGKHIPYTATHGPLPPPPPLPTTTTPKSTSCPVINHPLRCEPNTVLNFTRTGLRKIGDFFVNSTDTKELYLDYNDIDEISLNAFEALPRLQYLSIRGNNIPVNKLLWFKRHNTLRYLALDENQQFLDKNIAVESMFESLPNLRYLSLRRSKISRMGVSMQKFAPRLVQLDLSGNGIVSTDFLVDLPRTVENLWLDDNAIANVKKYVLANTKVLSLSGNQLTVLCGNRCSGSWLSLKGMSKLETLNVSRNRINSITVDAFADTPSLRTLDLSANDMDTLPNDAFNGVSSLQELLLSRNKFVYVPNMCQLQNIQHVDLSENKIQILTNSSFCLSQCYIKTINLAGNGILNINHDTFHNLVWLQRLDLSDNDISELPIQLIANAQFLQVLLLKNNRIMNIEVLFNVNSNRLAELHLQGNPLPSLKVHILPKLTIQLKDFNPIREKVDATTTEASDSKQWSNSNEKYDQNVDFSDENNDYNDNIDDNENDADQQ